MIINTNSMFVIIFLLEKFVSCSPTSVQQPRIESQPMPFIQKRGFWSRTVTPEIPQEAPQEVLLEAEIEARKLELQLYTMTTADYKDAVTGYTKKLIAVGVDEEGLPLAFIDPITHLIMKTPVYLSQSKVVIDWHSTLEKRDGLFFERIDPVFLIINVVQQVASVFLWSSPWNGAARCFENCYHDVDGQESDFYILEFES
jgi:hypothetical protein